MSAYIRQLYLYVGTDDDGDEGVISTTMRIDGRSVEMPLVCGDPARLMCIQPIVQKLRSEGHKLRLIRVDTRTDLTPSEEEELVRGWENHKHGDHA